MAKYLTNSSDIEIEEVSGTQNLKFNLASGVNTRILNLVYPIGSIYISTNNTNPSSLFGGTWQAFGTGRTLVGVDTNDTNFNTVEKTGGEKTHTLVENELPSLSGSIVMHSAEEATNIANLSGKFTAGSTNSSYKNGGQTISGANSIGSIVWAIGSNQAHNNLQPYITVYMWKRIS